MGFKKLALAAAVAAAPMSALALEPMQDEAMSAVTGQDGISISLGLDVAMDMYVEDTDGVADGPLGDYDNDAGTPDTNAWTGLDNAGFIVIKNLAVDGTVNLDIDSGSATGGGGVLNIGIEVPTITIGDAANPLAIGVAASSATSGARDAEDGLTRVTAASGSVTDVITLDTITLENVGMNVQLGPDAEEFLRIDADAFDLDIANFTLNDSVNDGSIFMDQLFIGNIDLSGTTAGIYDDGLRLTLGGSGGTSIAMMGVALGTTGDASATPPVDPAPALGNVYITGLDLAGTTVTIAGK